MGNRWEKVETVSDFILGGSKIIADGNCSHEIKRRLLLGRKVMTKLCQPVAEYPMEESEATEDGESRRCKEPGSLSLQWEDSSPREMSGTCKVDFSQKRIPF